MLAAGYAIIGVSKDKQESQQKFANNYNLEFPLIADTSTELHSKKNATEHYLLSHRNGQEETELCKLRQSIKIERRDAINTDQHHDAHHDDEINHTRQQPLARLGQ